MPGTWATSWKWEKGDRVVGGNLRMSLANEEGEPQGCPGDFSSVSLLSPEGFELPL